MFIDPTQIVTLLFWGILIVVVPYEILMYLRGKSSQLWDAHSARVINVKIGEDR